jgi:hypothetical protein
MASLEQKVVSFLLGIVRARRGESSASAAALRTHAAGAVPPAKVREAQFSDFVAVADLKRRWDLTADSLENWERIWHHNPALQQMRLEPPIGWVLEADGAVVGYLGNVSLIYHYGDRVLRAVVGTNLVVEPAYRAIAFTLNAAYYRQQSVDLFLTTTAIEAVGRIARSFKCLPLPQADYDSMLFWVLQPEPFAKALMEKLQLNAPASRIASVLAACAVRADRMLRQRRPSGSTVDFEIRDIALSEMGGEFGELWRQKLKEPPRLLADRDPATLRWHFDVPHDAGSQSVLCCYKHGSLLGYAVVRHETAGFTGLRRSIIADMLAREDDPAVLSALWVASYERAKKAGSHIFEVLGFPPGVREIGSPWHPYLRKYPACPFYYKATDAALHQTLSDGKAWYASPFDGDTTL